MKLYFNEIIKKFGFNNLLHANLGINSQLFMGISRIYFLYFYQKMYELFNKYNYF